MLNKIYFKIKKNERKKKFNYIINTPKKNNLLLNTKTLSLNDLICHSPTGKNKIKFIITNLLSSSKGLIINRNKFNSSIILPKNFHYFYPYRPNSSQIISNLSQNEDKTKLILSPRINDSVYKIKGYMSPKSMLSSDTSSPKYKINFDRYDGYYKLKKNKLSIDADHFNVKSSVKYNRNYNIEENKCNSNESRIFNNKLSLDESNFVNFIDEINKDLNYINKYKEDLKEYFIFNEKKNGCKSFLEKLLYDYRFEDHNNYFLTDLYSVKSNNFNIGNINISFKIKSLEFIFYEITEDKLNENNIDSKVFSDYENNTNIKYNINTKIKFPFEFLSIFYGINFDEFINLLISIIEFDYENDKFTIDHNTFITKIEMGKTLYDFYTESSYFYLSLNDNSLNKEYFLFDWDVKNINDNTIRRFGLKMILPQMKIIIKCANQKKIKFYSTISIKKMVDLIRNSFYKWDYYILLNFSEFKTFRNEINKILCGKYLNMNEVFSKDENDFKNEKNMKKILFNLNKKIIILNTIKKNNVSYGFFYSHKKLKNNENETYYINLKLPKISISYQNLTHSFHKKFDIDLKRLSQLNRLRKSFCLEDIIKYSMIIKKSKYKEEKDYVDHKMKKLPSKKKIQSPYKRSISSSIMTRNKNNSLKSNLQKNKSIKDEGSKGHIKFSKNFNQNDEFIKDIKLNLDKYIFNFDETILKYIKVKENHKNKYNGNLNQKIIPINEKVTNNNVDNQKNNDNIKNEKRLDIEIGPIELSWTNQDALTKNIMLDKKDSEYLLDYPTSKWRFFIEENIEKILSDEKNIIKPIRRSSKKNFFWRDFITKKEV